MTQSVSPLQAATLRGEERIIRYLLEKGADVNCPARSSCGVTPLQAICFACDLRRTTKMEIVKLFLEHGANVNAAPAWNLGLSALQAAAFVGDLEVAKLLVSHDADVNAPACKYGGGTALALAARKGYKNMVRYLLEVGAAIPAAGVQISSSGVTYEDNRLITDLLGISASDLEAMHGSNGIPSRDYYEYKDDWQNDPTYM
ncbi:ankyrin repeat-containing domain protein [Diaporthe sp. PMI_573]|nr:ankyrin repeat-containing domain protein [Diaporthaceae sp. PMI_573]